MRLFGWELKKQLNIKESENLSKENDTILGQKEVSYSFPSSNAREQKILEDTQNTLRLRVPVKDLQKLYLSNQFIFRGVNVRADELISSGYDIIGEDQAGVDACNNLIERSGGANLFWQLSINTDVCGDGYLEKIPSKDGKSIATLRHINPVNFGFWAEPTMDKIVLDSKGDPEAYMQVYYDEESREVRTKIPKENISHLRFNTFGDEFNGISTIQPVFNTAVRLMNMEHAAAEAAVKTANPLIVGKTKTKNPTELQKWSAMLANISGKDQIFLPDGVELSVISPGAQNFNDYASYFLDATVAALGVPKSILLGSPDSGGGNRGTVQVQSKHFYSVIRANQRYMEKLFNDIFDEYAERGGFKAPKLQFDDLIDDAIQNSKIASELYAGGLLTLEESRDMIGYDTDEETRKKLELEKPMKGGTLGGKLLQDGVAKKEDAKFWHGGDGSQAGKKADQKLDPNVPSVQ